MGKRLDGKVAVITGAGSGIGEATAARFHDEGARVVAVDVTGAQDAVVERLGEGALAVQADVSDPTAVQAAVHAAVEAFGRLDVIVNNAGIDGALAPITEYDPDDWDKVLAVNLKGVFLGIRYAMPEIAKAGGGSIISTASIAANVVFPQMPAYSAAKAGVLALTRSAAVEGAPLKVRVNALLPGVIDTGMTRQLPEDLIQGTKAATPLGYIGSAEEMAHVALFLASDESSFITGQSIVADGGYTAV